MRFCALAVIGAALTGCSTVGLGGFEIREADPRFLEAGTESRTYSVNNRLNGLSWDFSAESGQMLYLNPARVVRENGNEHLLLTVKHVMKHASTEPAQMMNGPTAVILIADGQKFTHEADMDYDIYTYESVGLGTVAVTADEYCRIATSETLAAKIGWVVIENDERAGDFQENLRTFYPHCTAATSGPHK